MAKVKINKYNIIILDDNFNGKRFRLSTGKKSTKQSINYYERNFHEEFRKLYENKYGKQKSMDISFRDYGKEVMEITSSNRNKFSQKEETQRFNSLCETFGEMNIADIRPSTIIKWQNESPLAPKTICNYRGVLNIVLHMAYCDDLIAKNPLTMVKAPRIIRKEVEIFTEDEMKLLIENAQPQLKNILQFNFFQGLRGSEVIALRWSNVDFMTKKLTVSRRVRDGDEDQTKSKTIRVIDLLPQSIEALKRQQRLTGLKSEFIFLTQFHKPYKSHDTLTVQLKALCKDVGIKERTIHVTRKTCNTLYKQYGLSNDWILHQIGHMDDEVNRNHYTGKIQVDLEKIGRVLA
jgi:integrase